MKELITKESFKKKMHRNLNKKKVTLYFNKEKKIIPEDYSTFSKKNHIHGIIKLSPSDYKLIKKNTKRLTHFNLQWTTHKPKRNYLIVKIDRKGYFDGNTYKPAILDGNNFVLVKCLSAQNHINYTDLKDNVFKYSLSNIKDINALKRIMKKRYKKILANLSDLEKLSLGVAITKLKIIKSNYKVNIA